MRGRARPLSDQWAHLMSTGSSLHSRWSAPKCTTPTHTAPRSAPRFRKRLEFPEKSTKVRVHIAHLSPLMEAHAVPCDVTADNSSIRGAWTCMCFCAGGCCCVQLGAIVCLCASVTTCVGGFVADRSPQLPSFSHRLPRRPVPAVHRRQLDDPARQRRLVVAHPRTSSASACRSLLTISSALNRLSGMTWPPELRRIQRSGVEWFQEEGHARS